MALLTKKRIATAAVFLGLVIGVAAYSTPVAPAAEGSDRSPIEVAAEELRWGNRIQAVGGKRAYEELFRYVEPRDTTGRHVLAHIFGKELYLHEDLAGVSVCDDRLSYGCFHEFLAEAVSGHGLGAVAELDKACEKQDTFISFMSCQHGVGHGILATLGYTEKDLIQALDVCKTLPHPGTMLGCYTGVFMEFNRHTMIAQDVGPRYPTDGDYIYPCNIVDKEYRPACVFWQPAYWQTVIFSGAIDTGTAAKVGDMCRTLAESIGYEDPCFHGVGWYVANYGVSYPQIAIDLCIAAAAGDRSHELLCQDFAAYALSTQVSLQHGLRMCADLSGKDKKRCEAYAHFTGSIIYASDVPSGI